MMLKKLLTGFLCSAMILGCSFSGMAAENPKASVRAVLCEALASDAEGNLYLFPDVSFGL